MLTHRVLRLHMSHVVLEVLQLIDKGHVSGTEAFTQVPMRRLDSKVKRTVTGHRLAELPRSSASPARDGDELARHRRRTEHDHGSGVVPRALGGPVAGAV